MSEQQPQDTEWSHYAAVAFALYFLFAGELMAVFTTTALATTGFSGAISRASGVQRAVAAVIIVLIVAFQLGVFVLGCVAAYQLQGGIDPKGPTCLVTGWLVILLLLFFLSIVLLWARFCTPPACAANGGKAGADERDGSVYEILSPFLFTRKGSRCLY